MVDSRLTENRIEGECWCNKGLAGYAQHARRRAAQKRQGKEVEPFCEASRRARLAYDKQRERSFARPGNTLGPKPAERAEGPCWCRGGTAGYNQHRRQRRAQVKAGEETSPFCADSANAKKEYDKNRHYGTKKVKQVGPAGGFHYYEDNDPL
jgi:hypothetical protein